MDNAYADPTSVQSFFKCCALIPLVCPLDYGPRGQNAPSSRRCNMINSLLPSIRLLDLHSQEPGHRTSVIHFESFGETAPHLVNFVSTSAPNDDNIYRNQLLNNCIRCSPQREQTGFVGASSEPSSNRKVLSVWYLSFSAHRSPWRSRCCNSLGCHRCCTPLVSPCTLYLLEAS